MKKKGMKILLLLVALCLCLASVMAAGCNGGDGSGVGTPIITPENPDPEKPDPEKPDPEKPDPEKPDPEKPDIKPKQPDISFGEGVQLELRAKAGERIDLPVATAIDILEGDISEYVWVHPEMNGRFCTITDEVKDGKVHASFVSETLGTHTVSYEVENEYGMSSRKSVTVTVTSDTYKDKENDYADISVLASGGRYTETFADFKGDFVKNLPDYVRVAANADSIEGNSLFIDYGVSGNNIIETRTLVPYFKSGLWKMSFDIKLVSGTISNDFLNDFYVGYRTVTDPPSINVNTHISDLCQAVKSMQEGESAHVTFDCNLIEIPDGVTMYFDIFCNNQTGKYQVEFAFDNFNFHYEKFDVMTETASIEKMLADGGLVYDFDDTFTGISNGKPTRVAELEEGEAKNAILAAQESGDFSGTLIHLMSNGNTAHNIKGLAGCFVTGYTYTLSVTYYTLRNDGNHLILECTGGNQTLKSGWMKEGEVDTVVFTFDYKATDREIRDVNIFGNVSTYVGKIRIEATPIVVSSAELTVSECNTSVTHDKFAEQGGYTYTQSENDFAAVGTYFTVDKLDDEDPMKIALNERSEFGDNVWQIKTAATNGIYLDALRAKFLPKYIYTVSFDAYVEKYGSVVVLIMDSENHQVGGGKTLTRTQKDGKVYSFTVTWESTSSDCGFDIFPTSGDLEMYVGKINVTAEAISVSSGEFEADTYADITAAELSSGYTFTQAQDNNISKGTYYVLAELDDEDPMKTALTDANGFGANVWLSKSSLGDQLFDALTGKLRPSYKYTIGFYVYAKEYHGGVGLIRDAQHHQINSAKEIKREQIQGNIWQYTVEWETGNSDYEFLLYPQGGDWELYIGNVTVSAQEVIKIPGEFKVTDCKTDITEDMLGDGYVFTHSDGNFASAGTYYTVAELDDSDPMKTALTDADGFGANVWLIKTDTLGNPSLTALNGKFRAGYTYIVEFNAYVKTFPSGLVLMMNRNGSQNGSHKDIVKTQKDGNIYRFYVRFVAVENDYRMEFYPNNGAWEIFAGNITVTEEETGDPSWKPLAEVGDKLIENFTDQKLGQPHNTQKFEIVKQADRNYVLHCDFPDSTYFFNVSGGSGDESLLRENRTYKISFRYKASAEGTVRFGYTPDGSGTVNSDAIRLTATDEWLTAQVLLTVSATQNNAKKHFSLSSGDAFEVWMDDLTIECIPFVESDCNSDVTREEWEAGYTYTQEPDNIAVSGSYFDVTALDEEIQAEIATAENFGNRVWYLLASQGNGVYMDAFEGKFVSGYEYTVTFDAYVLSYNGGAVLIMNGAGSQSGSGKNISREAISGNLYKFTVTWAAGEEDCKFMLYPQSNWEMYVGNITVTARRQPDPSWSPLAESGDALEEDFFDNKLSDFTSENFTVVDDGTGNKMLQIIGSQDGT